MHCSPQSTAPAASYLQPCSNHGMLQLLLQTELLLLLTIQLLPKPILLCPQCLPANAPGAERPIGPGELDLAPVVLLLGVLPPFLKLEQLERYLSCACCSCCKNSLLMSLEGFKATRRWYRAWFSCKHTPHICERIINMNPKFPLKKTSPSPTS